METNRASIITIHGKTYTVETSQAKDGTRYILTGKRNQLDAVSLACCRPNRTKWR